MKSFFHPDSKLFQILNTFADLVLLNILTLICSMPIFTIGAATTALYFSVEKLQRKEGSLFRSYIQSFKQNFLQATVLWIILLVVGVAIYFGLIFYKTMGNVLFLIPTAISVLIWCVVVSWMFPLVAKFYLPTSHAIKNAFLCGIAYWPVSLLMTALNFLPFALCVFAPSSFLQVGFLWLTIWFSAVVFCNLQLLRIPFTLLAEAKDIQ